MTRTNVIPRVHCIAATQILHHDVCDVPDALDSLGIPNWTTDAETDGEWLIEFAGKLCYSSFDTSMNRNLTRAGTRNNHEYIRQQILDTRHGSVLEHVYVTFLFQDVSRVVTHEVVRHRAGTAFSQTSGRYVRADVNLYFPRALENVPGAREVFERASQEMTDNFAELERLSGIDGGKVPFATKKKLTSAFRRILGNGQANNILVSANLRSWRHMIAMRTSQGAEEEIRLVFGQVAEYLADLYKGVFADMTKTEVDGMPMYGFMNDKV